MHNIDNKKPLYKKWWGIFLIIILSLVLIFIIALGFYVFSIVKRVNNYDPENLPLLRPSSSNYENKETIEGKNNYWLGSANPKIIIVEFGDFSCPLCKNSFSKIREISLKYNNDVKIIYRDYPGYENSIEQAQAARCAGEQGLFWLMYDKLFQNQGEYDIGYLSEMANQTGADINRFNDCLAKEKYLTAIKKDFADAEKLEVSGTPTWFINGYKIPGDIPYDTFIQIIEESLQNF